MVELSASQQCGSNDLLAYEELLEDAMCGNPVWFAREDYVEESWRVLDPLLKDLPRVHTYKPGSWGPEEANELTRDVGGWSNPV